MRTLTPALVLLLLASNFAAAQQGPTENEDPTFRVKVQLVQVDVQVLRKKTGPAVATLDKDDFQIYEDGVRQQIAQISRDQLPLSVVLLFDLTDSVRPVLKPLAAGALESLNHLKPEDEVAVMVYAATTQVLQDFTTDRAKVVTAIQKAGEMKSGEAAFFNQAVFDASTTMENAKNPQSRRAIIWLSDNVPNIPGDKQHSEKDAIAKVFETGTVIYGLVERSAMSDFFIATFSKNPVFEPFRRKNPPGNIHKYAERTGGDVMTSSTEDVSRKLGQMIDEIRTRYTLGYYPSKTQPKGKFCSLTIKMAKGADQREGSLQLRSKEGYYR